MKNIQGIAASPGIAQGKTFVFAHQELDLTKPPIQPAQCAQEQERFYQGRKLAEAQIRTIHKKALKNLSEAEAEVFEGHIELLNDEELESEINDAINKDLLCAELAVKKAIDANVADMEELENEYMRERAADLRDIGKRLMYCIAGVSLADMSAIDSPVIVIAKDLTPSETAQMDKQYILGFITAVGGPTSHVAIMARSLEIPAVVGCGESILDLASGQFIVLDGSNGSIVVDPDTQTLETFRTLAEQNVQKKLELSKLKDLPAITTDNHRVEMAANIGSDSEVTGVLGYGAEGIGLFRTEFLFMDKASMPTEEEQFEAYKKAAQGMGGKGVIVRTIDVGGDKGLDYLAFPHELNPFLGWRAIRMCFDTPSILQTQLRALLRASAFGKIRIMFPMVISVEEVWELRKMVDAEKKGLESKAIAYDPKVEIGIMIETPAAAVIANKLARYVDFLSIGTNDLTQYTLAIDRGNEKIAHLYRTYHPAVLRLISTVVQAAHSQKIWAGMCGEFAGNQEATKLLVGLGLDELSMSGPSIPRVKSVIRSISYSDARALATKALDLETADQVEEMVRTHS